MLSETEIVSAREERGETRAKEALDQIMALIRAGELRPGSILKEVELAKRFSMSRGPVREAIRNLEGRKIVEREAFQRARITPLRKPEIVAIFQLRECLEGMAFSLAAARMSDSELDALVEDVERSSDPSYYGEVFNAGFKFKFHAAVVSRCGNERIKHVLDVEVYELIRLYRWIAGTLPGRGGSAQAEHLEIAKAMRVRDMERVEKLTRAHIHKSMIYLLGDGNDAVD
ncbi:GntR family transcriptional regulator [Agrobacterium larrymoorei]|uniref:GntR family transcriptional regulator n=1 Tax=Agrobacterium larrymoorei TaxID=160699 RepID=A0AAF0HEM6_9HYPH|nr:GntR family transcriptional regulator [Agrobacterium larrymoorei]QYA09589.1 GntR family transcriptional regulator [Agrobacterium larrymoorei]WHA42996.1 GntR family transcriptional regulator [Agrobacterium larrymoorei]